jgi:raffinose/stachyose/melibiose transport system permease protein
MAIAVSGAEAGTFRGRSPREIATVATGAAAIACFGLTLYFVNKVESRSAFIALAAFVATTMAALLLGYRKRPYLAFVVPALAVYTMFVMFPAVEAFRFSLYNWSGLGEPTDYIGLANYREIFHNREFGNALWNNIQLFLAIFVIQNIVGLPLALALDTKLRGYEFYRAALFMPVIVSLVATGYIWQIILGPNIGMLNPLLVKLGQPDLQRDWLADNFLTFKLIWVVQAWQHLGYPIVIYLAGLQAIPTELREAARIDGANPWQVFKAIVFPLLAPAFTIVTATSFIGMFRAFDIPFILGGPGGAPDGTTDVLTLVIYREAFGLGGVVSTVYRQGYAVAAGVVMFGFLLIAVSIQVLILRRREVEL